MSLSQIAAHVDFTVVRHARAALTAREGAGPTAKALDRVVEHHQRSNLLSRYGLLNLLKTWFAYTSSSSPGNYYAHVQPWRPPPLMDGQNPNVRMTGIANAGSAGSYQWDSQAITCTGTLDYARYKQTGSTNKDLLSTDLPMVVGSLAHVDSAIANGTALSLIDMATTQIGPVYQHPTVLSFTCATTVGQAYLTGISAYYGIVNSPRGANYVRITSGASKGVYRVRYYEKANGRIHLVNLDGTAFTAAASEGSLTVWAGPGIAWFNQSAVIPNSVGTVQADGVFAPGENRNSYVYRIYFDKTGSPTPSDASQTGTYWLALRPFAYGDGSEWNSEVMRRDDCGLHNSQIWQSSADLYTGCSTIFDSASMAPYSMVFQRSTQRVWQAWYNGSGSAITWHWLKGTEAAREVISTAATSLNLLANVTISGGYARRLDIGSDDAVYALVFGGANAGLIRVEPDGASATQWLATSSGYTTAILAHVVDRTRARKGGAATVTTSAGTGNVTFTDAAFTQADVGRVVKITGGADAGTYKISVVTDGTHATVTQVGGGAVTFTGQAATGTWEIGDRIYLFWNDATTNAGKVIYMESLAFGVTHTRTVTMTNGAQLYPSTARIEVHEPVAIDPANSVLYWYSTDTTAQLNRFDPAVAGAGGWSRRLLSGDLNATPAGGSGTIVAPTAIINIAVNPHASFREIWCGTDKGWIKLDATNFAAAFSRYYGEGTSTYYQNPANVMHPHCAPILTTAASIMSTALLCSQLTFGIDGRVYGIAHGVAAQGTAEIVGYNREIDGWVSLETTVSSQQYATGGASGYYVAQLLATPYGEVLLAVCLTSTRGTTAVTFMWYPSQIDYQWIGGAWTPKEVVHGTLPDATSQPGLLTKPLHAAFGDLPFGVRVKFTPQGGATPANNEFVGRMAQSGPQKTDGATTNGSANFGGSGFSAGDVDKYLRIESGVHAGTVLRIATYVNANTVTLQKLNPQTPAWTATATAGTLSYTVWETGNYGPESASVLGANGFAKDNTQDLTGINFEWYMAKAQLSDQQEAVKFAVPYIGPQGSPGVSAYKEVYAYNAGTQYQPAMPQGVAFGVGTPMTAADYQVFLGMLGLVSVGTSGRADVQYASEWHGASTTLLPMNKAPGTAVTLDLGLDVEVGAVVLRAQFEPNENWRAMMPVGGTSGYPGFLGNLHMKPAAAGAPAAASDVRLSGTGFTLATTAAAPGYRNTGTADFMGPAAVTAADAATVQGGNVITSALGRFTGREGQVIRLTTGTDQGYYRILAANGDGSQGTVRKIDQTAAAFAASAAGLGFTIHDTAVREEDILATPATTRTHKLTVERLIDASTAEFRGNIAAAASNATWEALKPTWNLVKRMSTSSTATPPNVKGNLTYATEDAREEGYHGGNPPASGKGVKFVWDLSDLTSGQRTGRYWKVSGMPAWWGTTSTNWASPAPHVISVEFYDPTGKRIDLLPDQRIDPSESNPSFLAADAKRVDWIQSANGACAHLAGVNGLATVGGALGDAITLAGGAKFLGYEVRRGATGSAPGGATFNTGGSDPVFTAADVGRFLRITSGPNTGVIGRIATQPGANQVTVALPGSGGVLTLAADAGPSTWTLHENITAGPATYDYIVIGGVEYPILALSDDLATITTSHTFLALAGQTWEIRKRASIFGPETSWATGSHQIVFDRRGVMGFNANDCGVVSRADGAITGGDGVFTGTSFTADDVGRILVVTAGANANHYRIGTYTNATTVTLVNARTGAAVVLAAQAGPITYKLYGERRFRASRYVSLLRA